MPSLNKIMLIGRLGRDPELQTVGSSSSRVCRFSLAVSDPYSGSRSGGSADSRGETTWFNVVSWEKLAEACARYLRKGSLVFVEGRITCREYTDRDNIKRQSWTVTARSVDFLDSGKNGGSGESGSQGSAAPAAAPQPEPPSQGDLVRQQPRTWEEDDFPF